MKTGRGREFEIRGAFRNKDYKISYDQLFKQPGAVSARERAKSINRGRKKRSKNYFELPIQSRLVKNWNGKELKLELSVEELEIFIENHTLSKKQEYFLGLDIIDAVFKDRGALKSFRFPLYIVPVKLQQSGRHLYLNPSDLGEIQLNFHSPS